MNTASWTHAASSYVLGFGSMAVMLPLVYIPCKYFGLYW